MSVNQKAIQRARALFDKETDEKFALNMLRSMTVLCTKSVYFFRDQTFYLFELLELNRGYKMQHGILECILYAIQKSPGDLNAVNTVKMLNLIDNYVDAYSMELASKIILESIRNKAVFTDLISQSEIGDNFSLFLDHSVIKILGNVPAYKYAPFVIELAAVLIEHMNEMPGMAEFYDNFDCGIFSG
jgi:hypothetical protein